MFGPPDFFADFLAGFFLRIFVGKNAQKNPPGKSSKIYTTKILRHISADWPGQHISRDVIVSAGKKRTAENVRKYHIINTLFLQNRGFYEFNFLLDGPYFFKVNAL